MLMDLVWWTAGRISRFARGSARLLGGDQKLFRSTRGLSGLAAPLVVPEAVFPEG